MKSDQFDARKTVLLWSGLIFICICIIVTMFAGAEAFLRYRDYQRQKQHYKPAFRRAYQFHPFVQMRPNPKDTNPKLLINKETFRGEPLDLSEDTFLIFTLGGSSSYSGVTPYEKTYPALLQKKLREKYPDIKIQVQNAALNWYTTQHSLILYLFKIRYYHPELVIVKHAINDLCRSFTPERWSRLGEPFNTDYSHYLGPLVRVVRRAENKPRPVYELRLWRKIKAKYLGGTPKEERDLKSNKELGYIRGYYGDPQTRDIRDLPSLPIFKNNLKLLAETSKKENTQVILQTQPTLYKKNMTEEEGRKIYFSFGSMNYKDVYPTIESLEFAMRQFNDAVLEIAREEAVIAVDLEKQMPKTLEYLRDDVHPQEKGMEMEAQLLFEEIVRLKLVEKWAAQLKKP